MDAADSSPAEVSRVAVHLPPFWPERPAMWFAQAKAQFTFAGISIEHKFFHVISQLEHRYATEVEDIITSPPKRDPYPTKDRACEAAIPIARAARPAVPHGRGNWRP